MADINLTPYFGISTHSLTRRLTFHSHLSAFPLSISTHSLTRRLTNPVLSAGGSGAHFNSQPHKEADNGLTDSGKRKVISTHSLTRRLTSLVAQIAVGEPISTHSLTRRLTRQAVCQLPFFVFQLTASQGG